LNITPDNLAPAPAVQPATPPHSLHPKYRPDIDGLRAIAVLSVVLFHAFPTALRGGFIGVDIFFVISGFLISTIIVGNLEHHSFSFADFYGRRVRRIFPVLLLVLASTFAAGWYMMLAGEFKQLSLHVASGAGFLSNFSFWHESGYFDTSAGTKPLLHLWSLGVEEQFYIVWPGLMWLAWKMRLNLLSVMIVAGLVSLALNINAIHVDPAQAFYSPQTRFWEMVCGSVLAWMTLHRTTAFAAARHCLDGWLGAAVHAGPRPADGSTLRSMQALLGAGLIALGMLLITEERAFPGWWALMPVMGAVLIIAAGPHAWFNRVVLSHRALVEIGLISFPLYLWHWPLLVFARIYERGTPAPALRIGAMAAALLLAWLSYVLVEKRLRSGRHNGAKTAVLVALMAAMGAAGYTVYHKGFVPAHMSDREAFSAYFENGLPGWHYFNEVGIPEKVRHDCEFFDIESYRAGHKTMVPRSSLATHCYQRDPSKPHVVVLWGDSHAEHLSYGIRRNLPAGWQLLQVASSSCTPYLDVSGPSTTDQCVQSNWFAQKLITETRPDVVVVAQNLGQTGERVEQIYWKLKSLGVKRIVVTGPVPHWTAPLPTLMLTKFWFNTPRRSYLGVDMDVFASNTRLRASIKPQDALIYADLTGFMCNAEGCLTYLGDDRKTGITSYDDTHLTPATSDYVGKSFLVGLITGTNKP